MKSAATPDLLPIFPLPNVVLFPTGSLPLYIFEPRYRAMTHAALKGDRRIGMAAIRPEALDGIDGNPAIFPVGCEGEISGARERPDGTLDILLVARRRFEILEESPPTEARPYRVARVEFLSEERDSPDPLRLAPLRDELLAALGELIARRGRGESESSMRSPDTSLEQLNVFSDGELVHVVAQAIELGVLEKQRLLEAPDVTARYQLIGEFLRFQLAQSKTSVTPGSSVLQ